MIGGLGSSLTFMDEKKVHKLIRKIWGTKIKKGYCWLLAKFEKTDLDNMTEETLNQIYECLDSKLNLTRCPIHHRIHDGR